MTATPTTIPAPPREVRWTTLFRERRFVGVLGLTLSLVGSGLALLGAAGNRSRLPFDDLALDSDSKTARANVHTVESSEHPSPWQRRVRHAFTFAADGGRTVHGESWADEAVCAAGDLRMVEYLPTDPALARVVGTRKSSSPTWLILAVLASLAAGFVLVLAWVRNLLRWRIALSEGRATSARIVRATATRHGQSRVEYQFTDPDGNQQRGEQTLSAGTELTVGALHPVIHDERNCALHRLVVAADFLPS